MRSSGGKSKDRSSTVIVYDHVMEEVTRKIAAFAPERGGFLFGKFETLEVMKFVYDEGGRTGGAHYYPSSTACSLIEETEKKLGLRMLGVLHSHPSSLDRPSGPDKDAIQSLFNLNPGMSFVLSPILTHNRAKNFHESSIPSYGAKLSWYITMRGEKMIKPLVEERAGEPPRTFAPFPPGENSS